MSLYTCPSEKQKRDSHDICNNHNFDNFLPRCFVENYQNSF